MKPPRTGYHQERGGKAQSFPAPVQGVEAGWLLLAAAPAGLQRRYDARLQALGDRAEPRKQDEGDASRENEARDLAPQVTSSGH